MGADAKKSKECSVCLKPARFSPQQFGPGTLKN